MTARPFRKFTKARAQSLISAVLALTAASSRSLSVNKLLLLLLLFTGCNNPKPITPERIFAQPCANYDVTCSQAFVLQQILEVR